MKFNDGKKLTDFMQKNTDKISVQGVKKIIAIASAKGGVGKSTIATNLAVLMANKGYNMALVDADIYGPSINYLMNLQGKPQIKNNLFIPQIANNVKCMSLGSILDDGIAGVWRGPMTNKILNQLIRTVDWQFDNNEVDFMIIDMPPGTGDIYLSLAQNFHLDGVILISTPQNVSIIDVKRSIDCFRKLNIDIIGLVQNMSFFEIAGEKKYLFGKDGAKKLAKDFDIRFLAEIPVEEQISNFGDNQEIAVNYLIESKFNKNLSQIIDILNEI